MQFIVKEETEQAKYKINYETNVNLFSPLDVDGNSITPVQTFKVFAKAKPVTAVSEWVLPVGGREIWANNPPQNPNYFMPIKQQKQYEIKNSLSWLSDFNDFSGGAYSDFVFLDFQNNASKITINIELDGVIDYRPQEFNTLPNGKNAQVVLEVYYGTEPLTAETEQINIWSSNVFQGTADDSQQLPASLSVEIDNINRESKLWISFAVATNNGAGIRTTFNEGSIKITATETAFNTVVPMVRLYDAMKYVTKSASGLDIVAPRFDVGGEFHNLFITTPSLMRLLTDRPLNWSLKGLVEGLIRPAFNGDYQLKSDITKVGYELYNDLYANVKAMDFDQVKYETYQRKINPKVNLRQFELEFQNYASKREAEQENTFDIVHGKKQDKLDNIGALNTFERRISVIFDDFYIEEIRRKALDLSITSATQDDDKIIALDCVPNNENISLNETANLKHDIVEFSQNFSKLILTIGNQEFNWLQIGVAGAQPFFIISDGNAGEYFVESVTDLQLTIIPQDQSTLNFNGIQITNFTYLLNANEIKFIKRTNEGFATIENLSEGDNYGNLKYTLKRITQNYYSSMLASSLLFSESGTATTTLYDNNPDAITQLETESQPLQEGGTYEPNGAILSPFTETRTVIATLSQYYELQRIIKDEGGYVQIKDFKGYVVSAEWTPDNSDNDFPDEYLGELTMELEERYEPYLVTIQGVQGQLLYINEEIMPSSFTFDIDIYELLSIFDGNGKYIIQEVPFDKVKVNNVVFNNVTELSQALINLQG